MPERKHNIFYIYFLPLCFAHHKLNFNSQTIGLNSAPFSTSFLILLTVRLIQIDLASCSNKATIAAITFSGSFIWQRIKVQWRSIEGVNRNQDLEITVYENINLKGDFLTVSLHREWIISKNWLLNSFCLNGIKIK